MLIKVKTLTIFQYIMVNYLTFYYFSIANFKMRTGIKEMIPRIEIQNDFIGNEKEKEAFTDAITKLFEHKLRSFAHT